MKSIVDNVAFDQIYHEHLLYYNLRTIETLLRLHGLTLFDAYLSPIHGGSIIGFIGHAGTREPTERLTALRLTEESDGANELATYRVFARNVLELKRANVSYLREARANNRRVFGLGAPAKGNTLLNFFSAGPELVQCLVEKNELRRGLFSPGMHIPIVLERELAVPPDIYYVLAWNFRNEILAKNRHLLDQGVEFHFPVVPRVAA
jgi:hypothetical protein